MDGQCPFCNMAPFDEIYTMLLTVASGLFSELPLLGQRGSYCPPRVSSPKLSRLSDEHLGEFAPLSDKLTLFNLRNSQPLFELDPCKLRSQFNAEAIQSAFCFLV